MISRDQVDGNGTFQVLETDSIFQYKYKELCRRVLMVIYNENGMIRSLIRIIPDKG